jgi:hypothetical protein
MLKEVADGVSAQRWYFINNFIDIHKPWLPTNVSAHVSVRSAEAKCEKESPARGAGLGSGWYTEIRITIE